jgi:peptidoglycan/LPS O-acetylase OafA/YrhL
MAKKKSNPKKNKIITKDNNIKKIDKKKVKISENNNINKKDHNNINKKSQITKNNINNWSLSVEGLFKRMIFFIVMIFLLGLVILYHNQIVGFSLIFAVIVGCFVGYFKYKKIKEKDFEGARNTINYFFVVMGLLLTFIGFFAYIFQKNNFNEFVIPFALGIVFLIYGLMAVKHKNFHSPEWKNIPLVLKLIMFFYSITILSNVIRLEQSFNNINLFFGIILSRDLSIILNFIYFLIPILIVFFIYERKYFNLLLVLFGFLILNNIINLIKYRTMTLPEILVLSDLEMPKITSVTLNRLEIMVKNTISVSLIIGIIIISIIAYYIYKNKDYFKKK